MEHAKPFGINKIMKRVLSMVLCLAMLGSMVTWLAPEVKASNYTGGVANQYYYYAGYSSLDAARRSTWSNVSYSNSNNAMKLTISAGTDHRAFFGTGDTEYSAKTYPYIMLVFSSDTTHNANQEYVSPTKSTVNINNLHGTINGTVNYSMESGKLYYMLYNVSSLTTGTVGGFLYQFMHGHSSGSIYLYGFAFLSGTGQANNAIKGILSQYPGIYKFQIQVNNSNPSWTKVQKLHYVPPYNVNASENGYPQSSANDDYVYSTTEFTIVNTNQIIGWTYMAIVQYYKREGYTFAKEWEAGNSSTYIDTNVSHNYISPYNDQSGSDNIAQYMKTSFFAGCILPHTTAVYNLKPKWTANTYTVTVNKGTGISAVSGGGSKSYGSSVSLSATLATGYNTIKWSGYTTSSSFTMPAQNVTMTASATANTYTISYNGNGNTGGSTASSSHTYDAAKNLTANGFTKTGYTFAGWATSASGSVAYANSASVKNLTSTNKDTVTLYAKWTADTYAVTYNLNGGSGTFNNQVKTYGSNLTLHSGTPTKTGYTFAGWKDSDGASYSAGGTYTKEKGTTLTAQWTVNQYTYNIVYKSSSGKELGTATVSKDYGSTNAVSPKDFAGYTSPASQSIKWDSTTAKTITFTYTPITYNITYSGTNSSVSGNPTTYTIESAKITLKNPSRTGYTFSGWTGSNGNTAQTSVSIATGSTGDKTYTTNWTAKTYNVTLNFNYSGAPSNQVLDNPKVTYGLTHHRSVEPPTRTGYTFKGFYTAASGGTQVYTANGGAVSGTYWEASGDKHIWKYDGDVTFYAQWTPNTYNVTYKGNGGLWGGADTWVDNERGPAVYDQSYTTWSNQNFFVREGYRWVGWNTQADGKGEDWTSRVDTPFTWTYDHDVTLYAQWELDTVKVNFNANGGSVTPANKDYNIQGKYTDLPTPTLEGYAFLGWFDAAEGGTQVTASTAVTKTTEHTLYAHWAKEYQIIWQAYNASTGKVGVIKDEVHTLDTIPANPTPDHRPGYEFLGWSEGVQDDTNYTVIFTAEYEHLVYTLTIDTQLGTPIGEHNGTMSEDGRYWTITGYYGDTVDVPRFLKGGFTHGSGVSMYDNLGTGTPTNDRWSENYSKYTFAEADEAQVVTYYPITYTISYHTSNGNFYQSLNYTTNLPSTDPDYNPNATPSTINAYGHTDARHQFIVSTDGNWEVGKIYWFDDIIKDSRIEAYLHGNVTIRGCGVVYFDTNADGDAVDCIEYRPIFTGQPYNYNAITDSCNSPLPTPTRAGRAFLGWYTSPTGGTKVEDTDIPSFNCDSPSVTLYAKWGPPIYTITFDTDGGAPVEDMTYTSEDKITLPTTTKDGYVLKRWVLKEYTDANGGNWGNPGDYSMFPGVQFSSTKWGNVTLKAEWTKILSFIVSFDDNVDDNSVSKMPDSVTGTVLEDKVTDKEFTEGNTGIATIPSTKPERPGYNFIGWHINPDAQSQCCSAGNTYTNFSGNDMTLYAIWKPVTYTVNYYSSSTDGVLLKSVTRTYGDGVKVLSPAECGLANKVGYNFLYWTNNAGDAEYHPDDTENLASTQDAVVNLYPKYEVIEYTITLDLNGGTADKTTITYTIEDEVVLPLPVREERLFNRWGVLVTGGNWGLDDEVKLDGKYKEETPLTGMYGDVTLRARWRESVSFTLEYHVEYVNADSYDSDYHISTESLIENSIVDFDKLAKLYLTEKQQAGLRLEKYELVGNFSTDSDGNVIITENTVDGVIKLYFKRNTFTLTIEPGTGVKSVTGGGTYKYQQKVPVSAVLKEGYKEIEWGITVDKDGNIQMPHRDLVLTPEASPIKYTVVYKANGGIGEDITEYREYNDDYTLPGADVFTRGGYTFSHWNTSKTGNGNHWIAGAPATSETNHGKNFTTVDGATVTFYAIWEIATYTVTYELDGGTNDAENPTEYTYDPTTGSEYFTVDKPQKAGYKFLGWVTTGLKDGSTNEDVIFDTRENSDDQKAISVPTGLYGDVVFTAYWEMREYYLVFDTDGGNTIKNLTYTIESTDTLPIPEKAGYEFISWLVVPDMIKDKDGKLLSDGNWLVNGMVDQTYASGTPVTGKYGWVYFKALWNPLFGAITITRPEGLDKDQDFLFTIAGKNTDENTKDVLVNVVSHDFEDINGLVNTIVIDDLPVGEYTVSEWDNWSWRHENITITNYPAEGEEVTDTSEFTLKPEGKDLTYKLSSNLLDKVVQWLSGDSYSSRRDDDDAPDNNP